MRKRQPPEVRQMWTIFDSVFTHAAKRFRTERPPPATCQAMLNAMIMTLRGYVEAIDDLLDNQ